MTAARPAPHAVVLNHAGYGQGNIHLPAFNPFDKLTDYNDPARVPGGCDPYGDAPAVNATLEQTWQCQFAGLPDLNYTQLEVRKKAADWLNWFIGQFGTHLLRFDAAGHVQPDVWPWLLNQTEIKLPAVLEVGGGPKMVDLYEQLRGPVPYGYQNFDFQETSLACFARLVTPGDAGCRQLSDMRAAYARIGADTRRAVFFVDNHDTDRFLSVYDSEPAFRNALAHALLSEGIPSIYYGSEQGMKGVTDDNTHRAPLWERGFGATHPNYKFIRTLAWYRWWMRLDLADFKEVYVDRDTFAFSRGNRLLAILTAGYANTTGPGARAAGTRPATYHLANLGPFAGQRLCDALLSGICLDVTADGSASVPSSPTDEPLVLVPSGWVRSSDFFTPMQARPARWQTALTVSLVTTAGSALVAALGIWALACYRAGRWAPLADLRGMAVRLWARARCGRLLPWHKRPGAASSSGDTGSKADGSVGGTSPVGWGGPGDAELGKATPECLELERQATALDWAVARLASPSAVEQACAAAEEKPTDSHAPSWCLSGARIQRLQSLAQRRADTPVHLLIDCLKEDPHMVMHVALEYAVPHLGLKLTFGGLGQVVSDLTTHAVRPMLVCAPMYAPFYTDPEAGVLNQLLGEQPPVLSLPALVGGRKHLVDVYLTVTPPGQGPPVFFLLLASQLFSTRQPGTIYQHDSEATELAFFSVFNQAVAHVVETLGVTCLQFHDVHGALSVMHLPPEVPVRCLLMAHNFDYQSNWHLGTKEREAYVYSMLHIPLNSHTRSLCEHAGKFSLVRPLLKHFRLRQNGLGVVAVSPNYAARIAGKSSLLWGLPRSAIHGTLNGLEAGELGRPDLGAASPADLDSFFDSKQEAKLALQAAKGLQVGADFKLCSFMGRITHQKGCDLIALAARDILKGSRQAQLLMVGPIGDEYGERAKAMLEEVSADFPGRVSNLAGEYCRGAAKQQLLLATDFFFCPSRFEPCGLADIEFGWMGAVQIGHSTGGLGKMPGFYYTAQLDCVEEQSLRLAATALKALRAPDEEIRRLATQALAAEFPVSAMVAAYEREWSTLCALPWGRLHGAPATMPAAEAAFYEQDWLEDNTPYIHQKASTERVQERHRRETKAWAANLLLVVLQALLQLPSALSLIWLLNMKWAGSIQFSEAVTWGSIVRSPTAIYFFIYAGSALLAQALGLLLPPLHYMRLAALTFVASTLCVVWALYVPQAAEALYYVSASLAAAWLPISPFVFFDLKRASVSQHGPLILGFSDVLTNAAMVAGAAVALQQQGSTNINGFLGVSIVLLVVGTFYLAWLLCPNPLSRTFLYHRLRLRGQAALLLRQRKAWLFGVALTTLESFGFALLGSYSYSILASDDCRWFLLTASLTAMVGSGLLGALLASRPGRRSSVRLMYVLAASPLVLGIQLVLLVYGGTVGLYFAGTVFSALFIFSAAVTGLLTLHTVPTRETFALVKTLQVSLGSLAIVAGLVVGGVSANRTAGAWVAGAYELARLPLVAGLIWWHRRENLAGP